MTRSHYSALFHYRPRPNREPLEDFLTCALTDVLNRLTQESMRAFVGNLLLNENARSIWSEIGAQQILRWSSQKSLLGVHNGSNEGRCDILLDDQDGPLLIIEVKIAAGFSHSRRAISFTNGEDDANESADQLARYGQWLGARCKGRKFKSREWPGALILLTHFTNPPEEFISSAVDASAVPFRNVCRWSQVSLWLDSLIENVAASDAMSARFLAKELRYFLGENNMSAVELKNEDLKAAENFICSGAAQNIVSVFQAVRKRLQPELMRITGCKKLAASNADYFSVEGIWLDYVYFSESTDLKKWCIEWGFCWSSSAWMRQLREEGTSVGDYPIWYVAVYCGDSERLAAAKMLLQNMIKLPDSWRIWGLESEHDCGMFSASEASEFFGRDGVEQVVNWTRSELSKITPTVSKLAR